MLGSADLLTPFDEAGNTYGTAMTAGMERGIEAGGPQLRSSAERTVTGTFSTPFDVTAIT